MLPRQLLLCLSAALLARPALAQDAALAQLQIPDRPVASPVVLPSALPFGAAQAIASASDANAAELPRNNPFAPAPEARPTEDAVRFRSSLLTAAAVGSMYWYGKTKWWQDGFDGKFKTVDEGWFGRGTEHGGQDKLGHFSSTYVGMRLLTPIYEALGNEPSRAQNQAFWASMIALIGVEVLDGFSAKWRFSKEDFIADVAGGLVGLAFERNPALDDLVDIRLQYRRSINADGTKAEFSPFGDYNGQRYLLVFKGSGVPALRQNRIARYLELSVGYGARNFEPGLPLDRPPTRSAYVGLSIDLAQLMRDTVYSGNRERGKTQFVTEKYLEFFQVPSLIKQTEQRLD
ncbi:MAG: hypothetical protein RL341_1358 [Pseudomonadota bacterium]|jgi:hypothetical protein